MVDLSWETTRGVLLVRLVVAGYPSDEQIENIGCELLELPARADSKIVLDLHEVEFISSLLLMKLIQLQKKCRAGQIDLRMCRLRPIVMEVIKVTRLDTLFKIHDSTEEAIGV
jgi:anti-sigma B factor antagonist